MDQFMKESIKKGQRKKGEDSGFEVKLDNGLLLETKIMPLKVPRFDSMFYHDILNAIPINSPRNFRIFKNKFKSEFLRNYENLLFKTYVHFFNEFKNLEGMSKRKDKLSRINMSMKKGIVTQALLRLVVVMNKEPYTFDKYLAHEVAKLPEGRKILHFIHKINSIQSYDGYCLVKIELRDYLDSRMPKRPYVGAWWKYLKEFKGI